MNPYIGHDSQLSGCYRFVYDDGPAKGLQAVEVYHQTGLRYTVLLSRGMDIGYASYKGSSFVHVGKSGFTSPVYFQNGGKEWGRAFGAGLVTTCGLDNVGPGFEKNREIYGDHDRFSSLTAEQVSVRRLETDGGDCFEISGVIRQAALFGENFLVTRTIRSSGANNSIELTDTIQNRAFEPHPLMVLYHCNFGYPLLSERSQLKFKAEHSKPRDAEAAKGFEKFRTILPPTSGFAEQVFYHSGVNTAELRNEEFDVRMTWDNKALPCFTQWNMFGAGNYVLGLEPGNCYPVGREEYLASGRAEYLEPGQKKKISLRFEIIEGYKL